MLRLQHFRCPLQKHQLVNFVELKTVDTLSVVYLRFQTKLMLSCLENPEMLVSFSGIWQACLEYANYSRMSCRLTAIFSMPDNLYYSFCFPFTAYFAFILRPPWCAVWPITNEYIILYIYVWISLITCRRVEFSLNNRKSNFVIFRRWPSEPAAPVWVGAKKFSMKDRYETTVLTSEQISKILPHRYPFLLVDRVVEFEAGEKLILKF